MTLSSHFSRPGYPLTKADPGLKPIVTKCGNPRRNWEENERPALRARWQALLGEPGFSVKDGSGPAELLGEQRFEEFHLASYRVPTGPGECEHVLILRPAVDEGAPHPCAVIPFYTAERSAGVAPSRTPGTFDLQRSESSPAGAVEFMRQFGLHLVRLGFVVACVEAFPFNTVADPKSLDFLTLWSSAAAKIQAAHPRWTGIGKLCHDTSRALDLLLEQPGIDRDRVLIMGHSLGGKMAFYTGCLDERISCIIASDFGLPWGSTNWDQPWYLGDKRPETKVLAHHQLLALFAPKPFFLIAGDTDGRESWPYLEGARPVYDLYNAGDAIGAIDHASGHNPTIASLEIAYAWLAERFSLSRRQWRA